MSTGFGPKGYWDQRFASTGFVYGEQPNDFLKEHASGLKAGQALCLAEGEGRNAVFLAELGHQVCAQDISPVGLGKAEELAQRRSVNIHTLCCDLAAFHPEPASLDLIAAIWMHLEPELRATVLQRAVEALRPGGHLLIEAYSPKQLGFSSGGPTRRELLIDAAELKHELAALKPLILQEVEREIAEGSAHQGASAVVQFFGRKP
tara:strand:- start:10 stop:624 length:615 start_codon:yes stop_codon:yes gene_type:complete